MPIVGGLDIHRKQITFDYLDTETGQVRRGQIAPADRAHLRAWLARFAGREDVAFAVEGCAGWRYVSEELAAAGATAHLAEPADTAAARGRKRHAKNDKTDSRHLRMLLAEGRLLGRQPLLQRRPDQPVPEQRDVLRPGPPQQPLMLCRRHLAPPLVKTGNFPAPQGGGCQRLCHRRTRVDHPRRPAPGQQPAPRQPGRQLPRRQPGHQRPPAGHLLMQRPQHRQDITGRARGPRRQHRVIHQPGQQPAQPRVHPVRPPGEPAQPLPHRRIRHPSSAATWFHGRPRAAASSAPQITSTPYCLRCSIESGSSTRDTPHAAHSVDHPELGGDSILPRCSGLGGRCLPRCPWPARGAGLAGQRGF